MDFEKIIESVYLLLTEKTPELDISSLLYTHRCYDLVRQMPNGTYYEKACLLLRLNKVSIRERIQACRVIFEQEDIPYVAMKGPILSVSAYGDPYLRQSGDIDVLIAPQDVTAFSRQMKKAGFIQGKIKNQTIQPVSREEHIFHSTYSHQVVPFIKKTGNVALTHVNVDVNTNLYWGESECSLNMEQLLFHRIPIEIDGVTLYKLEPISEFIALCLHHYKDMNSLYLLSQGSLRLRLFVDIYRYILRQREVLPTIQLRQTAEEWGALPYIYYCLFQTAALFPEKVVLDYRDAMQNEKGQNLLNVCGLTQEEQKKWLMPLTARLFSPDFKTQFALMLNEKDKDKIALNVQMMQ